MRLPPIRLASDVSTDIVVAGENSVDVLGVVAAGSDAGADKRPLASLRTLAGGQAATAAVGCARLGLRARYVGVVGDDDRGALVGEALAHERVDARLTIVPGVPTRAAMILVDEATGRRTVYERRHPSLRLDTAANAGLWTDARVLLVDATDPVASTTAARLAREAGVRTMVDVDARVPGVDVLLAAIDVIVVPETFSCAYTGEASPGRAIARLGAAFPDALIIATLGERGSLALAQGREIRTPAFPVPVVDTTGAGDAFRAGLAAAWLRGGEAANLERALAVANATAALNCRAEGAQQGLPSWEEVQTLVSAQS